MNLIGEYPVSIDNKGRLRLPSALLKQLGDAPGSDGSGYEFVVNKDFEPCLVLYPKKVWEAISEKLGKLNTFNAQNRLFVRRFYSGMYPTTTDSADRILLQKPMMEYAGLTDEAILLAIENKIEIWNPERYEKHLEEISSQFTQLSDVVMGGGEGGVGQVSEELAALLK